MLDKGNNLCLVVDALPPVRGRMKLIGRILQRDERIANDLDEEGDSVMPEEIPWVKKLAPRGQDAAAAAMVSAVTSPETLVIGEEGDEEEERERVAREGDTKEEVEVLLHCRSPVQLLTAGLISSS